MTAVDQLIAASLAWAAVAAALVAAFLAAVVYGALRGLRWACTQITWRRQARAARRAWTNYSYGLEHDDAMHQLAAAVEDAPLMQTQPGPRDDTFRRLEDLYHAKAANRRNTTPRGDR